MMPPMKPPMMGPPPMMGGGMPPKPPMAKPAGPIAPPMKKPPFMGAETPGEESREHKVRPPVKKRTMVRNGGKRFGGGRSSGR